jgi:hypothetical protein
VHLEGGWELAVLDRPPRRGFWTRYLEAVRSGWSRLIGRRTPQPPLVALSMETEDAQRLHHLFRSGLNVLVVAPQPDAE